MCKTWILQSYEDETYLNPTGKKSPINLLRDTLLQSLSRETKNLSTSHTKSLSGSKWKAKKEKRHFVAKLFKRWNIQVGKLEDKENICFSGAPFFVY